MHGSERLPRCRGRRGVAIAEEAHSMSGGRACPVAEHVRWQKMRRGCVFVAPLNTVQSITPPESSAFQTCRKSFCMSRDMRELGDGIGKPPAKKSKQLYFNN